MIDLRKIQKGDIVKGKLLLIEKELKSFKNKPGKYLQVELINKTGSISCKMWDNGEEAYDRIDKECVVEVIGEVNVFNNDYQLKLESIIKESGIYDPREFLPEASNYEDIEFEFENTLEEFKELASEEVACLIDEIFQGNFLTKFKNAPAAQKYHHAYLGGLMEHTLNVTINAYNLCNRYSHIDQELVFTGALLHDIGKVLEYTYDSSISYTIEGALTGHIIQGCMIVKNAIQRVRDNGIYFPEEKEALILHIIASHHGYLEWGSSKQPAVVEASIVHYADIIDADVFKFSSSEVEENKNLWSNKLKRFVYGKGYKPVILDEAAIAESDEKQDELFCFDEDDDDELPF